MKRKSVKNGMKMMKKVNMIILISVRINAGEKLVGNILLVAVVL